MPRMGIGTHDPNANAGQGISCLRRCGRCPSLPLTCAKCYWTQHSSIRRPHSSNGCLGKTNAHRHRHSTPLKIRIERSQCSEHPGPGWGPHNGTRRNKVAAVLINLTTKTQRSGSTTPLITQKLMIAIGPY